MQYLFNEATPSTIFYEDFFCLFLPHNFLLTTDLALARVMDDKANPQLTNKSSTYWPTTLALWMRSARAHTARWMVFRWQMSLKRAGNVLSTKAHPHVKPHCKILFWETSTSTEQSAPPYRQFPHPPPPRDTPGLFLFALPKNRTPGTVLNNAKEYSTWYKTVLK